MGFIGSLPRLVAALTFAWLPSGSTPSQQSEAARRFDEEFKVQAVRLVLDEGKSVGGCSPI